VDEKYNFLKVADCCATCAHARHSPITPFGIEPGVGLRCNFHRDDEQIPLKVDYYTICNDFSSNNGTIRTYQISINWEGTRCVSTL
jgi:hypothetical protein